MNKKGYKSKDGIAEQMGRIFSNYPEHRHYELAQALALKYNYNMSLTEKNRDLHSEYMDCMYPNGMPRPERAEDAKRLLAEMGSTLYHKSEYMKRKCPYIAI